MEQLRLFIAVELPPEIRASLSALQTKLQSADHASAKWVNPDGIHLTLKFLGNTGADKVDPIRTAMREAVKGVSPFQTEIKDLGAFPNLRRIQVIWVGLSGGLDLLQTLQNNIESGLKPLGFPPENRAFTPHLTLARVRETATPEQRRQLGEAITRVKSESNLIINVKSVSLMQSQLTRAGAIYTCLHSVDLKPSCQ